MFSCGIAEITKFFPTFMDFEQTIAAKYETEKIINREDFFKKNGYCLLICLNSLFLSLYHFYVLYL